MGVKESLRNFILQMQIGPLNISTALQEGNPVLKAQGNDFNMQLEVYGDAKALPPIIIEGKAWTSAGESGKITLSNT